MADSPAEDLEPAAPVPVPAASGFERLRRLMQQPANIGDPQLQGEHLGAPGVSRGKGRGVDMGQDIDVGVRCAPQHGSNGRRGGRLTPRQLRLGWINIDWHHRQRPDLALETPLRHLCDMPASGQAGVCQHDVEAPSGESCYRSVTLSWPRQDAIRPYLPACHARFPLAQKGFVDAGKTPA